MIWDFDLEIQIFGGGKVMDRWNEFIKLYNRFRFDEIPKMEGAIYHYTSPEGLKGIFDSKALYATDMYFLNDSNEGIYILDLIKENINKLCKENARLINLVQKELRRIELEKWDELIHSYTISFSCNGDSLEMWNYYTKGNSVQGYNIGFDVQKLMESIHIEILDEKGNPIQRNSEKHLVLFHGKVIYDKEKQMEIITTIFEAFYDKYQEINDEQMLDLVAHYMVSKALNYGQFF